MTDTQNRKDDFDDDNIIIYKNNIRWSKSLEELNDEIIKKNEGEYLMSPSYGISIADSLSYGDKYIVVHNDAYHKLTEAADTSFFGKIKYGWKLFALSVSDWKDAMVSEDYVEEFFEYLGRDVDL